MITNPYNNTADHELIDRIITAAKELPEDRRNPIALAKQLKLPLSAVSGIWPNVEKLVLSNNTVNIQPAISSPSKIVPAISQPITDTPVIMSPVNASSVATTQNISTVGAAPSNDLQPPDPFDVRGLRVEQDFSAALGVEKPLLTIPVRKPSKESFVRTHPSDDYWLPTAVIELKENREIYLIAPELRSALVTEATFGVRLLVVSITLQGVVFVWPLRVAGSDGRIDAWSQSALQAAHMARARPVRVTPNMGLGAYETVVAKLGKEPTWPVISMSELLSIAFKHNFIECWDHPVLRRLRGEL